MNGILEQLSAEAFDNATVLGNPAIESEIFMLALRDACESDQEYAALLESCGAELAVYGLIDNLGIATEVVKKIQVTDWKAANFNRIARRTAIRMSMINHDALYVKYKKYRDLFLEYRAKIYTKYGNKARTEARKIIRNARNKAANMTSDSGKSITDKMDREIAASEKK